MFKHWSENKVKVLQVLIRQPAVIRALGDQSVLADKLWCSVKHFKSIVREESGSALLSWGREDGEEKGSVFENYIEQFGKQWAFKPFRNEAEGGGWLVRGDLLNLITASTKY